MRETLVRLVTWIALGTLVLMVFTSALWWGFGPNTDDHKKGTPVTPVKISSEQP